MVGGGGGGINWWLRVATGNTSRYVWRKVEVGTLNF